MLSLMGVFLWLVLAGLFVALWAGWAWMVAKVCGVPISAVMCFWR